MSPMTGLHSKPILRQMMGKRYKWEMKYDLRLLELDRSNSTLLPERKLLFSMCFMSPTLIGILLVGIYWENLVLNLFMNWANLYLPVMVYLLEMDIPLRE